MTPAGHLVQAFKPDDSKSMGSLNVAAIEMQSVSRIMGESRQYHDLLAAAMEQGREFRQVGRQALTDGIENMIYRSA